MSQEGRQNRIGAGAAPIGHMRAAYPVRAPLRSGAGVLWALSLRAPCRCRGTDTKVQRAPDLRGTAPRLCVRTPETARQAAGAAGEPREKRPYSRNAVLSEHPWATAPRGARPGAPLRAHPGTPPRGKSTPGQQPGVSRGMRTRHAPTRRKSVRARLMTGREARHARPPRSWIIPL